METQSNRNVAYIFRGFQKVDRDKENRFELIEKESLLSCILRCNGNLVSKSRLK